MAGDCGSVFMALMQCLKATVSVTKAFVCVEGTVFVKETLGETKDICLCTRHKGYTRVCWFSVAGKPLYMRAYTG